MLVFKDTKTLKEYLQNIHNKNLSIGFVPTMGALHQGHLSLVKKSMAHNDLTIVSIFVNPTQFDNVSDLENYPNTLQADLKNLRQIQCDIAFTPCVEDLYSKTLQTEHFCFDGLEFEMEGKHRKNHFNGVGTIVKKLFEIVTPKRAYFGEKDFQQLQIIKKLNQKEKLGVEIIGCPTFREKSGLAMSSRNTRLSKNHSAIAPFIFKTLEEVQEKFRNKSISHIKQWVIDTFNKTPDLKLDYFEIADEKTLKICKQKNNNIKHRAFIAVFAGDIRLIDNCPLTN